MSSARDKLGTIELWKTAGTMTRCRKMLLTEKFFGSLQCDRL